MKTTLIIFFVCNILQGASKVNFDSILFKSFNKLYEKLDSQFSTKKTADIEFRLWTHPSITDYTSVFILRNNTNFWTARFFEFRSTKKITWTEGQVNQKGLDSLWQRMVKNKLLTLATADSLRF